MSESIMKYKDYVARVYYSEEDGLFAGRLAGIRHIVDFHGETVKELRRAFCEAVDDYLQTCAREEIIPQRPYSGKLVVRLGQDLHAKIALKAELSHKPLNAWIKETLEKEALS
jgi:predicted HicB family RNase H-like nuclease